MEIAELSSIISKIAGSTEVLPWQMNRTFIIGLFLLLNVDMWQIMAEFSKLLLPVSSNRDRVATTKKERLSAFQIKFIHQRTHAIPLLYYVQAYLPLESTHNNPHRNPV